MVLSKTVLTWSFHPPCIFNVEGAPKKVLGFLRNSLSTNQNYVFHPPCNFFQLLKAAPKVLGPSPDSLKHKLELPK